MSAGARDLLALEVGRSSVPPVVAESLKVRPSAGWCLQAREAEAREQVRPEARQMLTPTFKASKDCLEADFVIGGLCEAHEEALDELCKSLETGHA